MPDIAASILARLKQKSAKTGHSNQLYLQLFCQEEFLRRLQHSRYVHDLTLKGGLLIYSMSGFQGRPTMDIDFLAKNIPNESDEVKAIITEIIKTETSATFVSFTIYGITPISVTTDYPGISVSIIGRIKNVKVPFKIDVAFGDVLFGKTKKALLPTQLDDFASPEVQTYPMESVIAEKTDAILSLLEFSSRMKDYYDIWFLSNRLDLDGALLYGALSTTFLRRKRSFDMTMWESFANLSTNETMSNKWNLFIEKANIQAPKFNMILEDIKVFLHPPCIAVIMVQPFDLLWSAKERVWYSK